MVRRKWQRARNVENILRSVRLTVNAKGKVVVIKDYRGVAIFVRVVLLGVLIVVVALHSWRAPGCVLATPRVGRSPVPWRPNQDLTRRKWEP
jgi:hypothetical protein